MGWLLTDAVAVEAVIVVGGTEARRRRSNSPEMGADGARARVQSAVGGGATWISVSRFSSVVGSNLRLPRKSQAPLTLSNVSDGVELSLLKACLDEHVAMAVVPL